MSSVLRSLMVRVGADLTDFQKGMGYLEKDLGKIAKKVGNAGRDISSAGSMLTKGLTVPIVGAVTGLTGLAVKASNTADELLTLSSQTGISTKTLQELQYASKFVDVEMEDMTKGLSKVTKATGAAAKKGEDYITIADGLTVSTKDANGKLLDSEDIFYNTIDALGGMADETQREIAAQEIFGKSYQDIMPLINAGSDALKKYGAEAENVGAVMSDKTVGDLGKFNDQIEKLKAVVTTAGANIGAAFLPVIEKITPLIEEKIVPAIAGFADKISAVIDWFTNLDPHTQKFILTLVGILAAAGPVLKIVGGLITNISGLFKIAKLAVSGFSLLSGAFSFILSPAGLVIAAIAAIAAAAYLIYDNWEGISNFFKKLWDDIVGFFEKGVNAAIGLINLIPGVDVKEVDWTKDEPVSSTTSPVGRVNNPRATKTTSLKLSDKMSGATYAEGTNFVPMTGWAMLHKGETVIPANQSNVGYKGGLTINITGNTIANDYDVDRIGNLLVQKLKLAGVRA